MARIKINDLSTDVVISKEEMKKVFGGLYFGTMSTIAPTLSISIVRPNPYLDPQPEPPAPMNVELQY